MPEGGCPHVDFDQHSAEYAADWQGQLDHLVQECPLAYTDAHGGFYIISKHEDVAGVGRDWERFSSHHDTPGGDPFVERERDVVPPHATRRQGVLIPEGPLRFVPSEADPPLQADVRRLEAPHFTVKAVQRWIPSIRKHVDEQLDGVIDSGRVDFAWDFAVPVATKAAMAVIGFDLDVWEPFKIAGHLMSCYPPDAPEFPYQQIAECQEQIRELVRARMAEPRDDVASALVTGEVLGRKLTVEEAQTVLNALSFAGSETTTSVTLNALVWLADHPDERERLRRDPSLITGAVEEFLRFYSPGIGTARTVTTAVEVRGHELQDGDRVLLNFAAANRDPDVFEAPGEVRLDRKNAGAHMTFGAGVHRCLGHQLARLEIKIMLERVLEVIPDYEIERDQIVPLPRIGMINSYEKVPATFTPGVRGALVGAEGPAT